MEFGKLIEYNMRNIFLEKSHRKCDGKTSTRPFSKKSKLSLSLHQESKIFYSLLLLFSNKLKSAKRFRNNHRQCSTVKKLKTFFMFIIANNNTHIETKFLTTCFYLV